MGMVFVCMCEWMRNGVMEGIMWQAASQPQPRPRPTNLPGLTLKRPPATKGSARRAATSSSFTLGKITFCSTVSRSSPPL